MPRACVIVLFDENGRALGTGVVESAEGTEIKLVDGTDNYIRPSGGVEGVGRGSDG